METQLKNWNWELLLPLVVVFGFGGVLVVRSRRRLTGILVGNREGD
jgi:hypothetical protein